MPSFYHLLTAKFLKFLYRTIKNKCSVLITITAIELIETAVGIGAAALRILLHGHSATLTKFVLLTHDNVIVNDETTNVIIFLL